MGFLVKFSKKKMEDIKFYLNVAVENILEGKIIGFPTNSVYGIGGSPLNLEVIERIFRIKFRDPSKGLLLLVKDLEEASKIAEFNETALKLANAFWPGQLTLILKRKEPNIIPPEISSHQKTIGLRVPENKYVLEILKILKQKGHFGGIIGTSANYSGEPPAIDGTMVAKYFLGTIDYIMDAGKSISKLPTTMVDCSSKDLRFLRIGKISKEEIEKVLKDND